MSKKISDQFGRVKGAKWFPTLYGKEILVLGQGGIGSWVSVLLSRIGCNLEIYDMDRFELHNMTGQLVRQSDIGKLKTEAVKNIIKELAPEASISAAGQYTEDSLTNDIVICGFDNMDARKLSFMKWKEMVMGLPMEDRRKCFFQDGRLNVEQLEIYNIAGDDDKSIALYEETKLPEDSTIAEQDCTFKQTSHSAAMIAGHMVGFLTNWATNMTGEKNVRKVPFTYKYFTPINLTTTS